MKPGKPTHERRRLRAGVRFICYCLLFILSLAQQAAAAPIAVFNDPDAFRLAVVIRGTELFDEFTDGAPLGFGELRLNGITYTSTDPKASWSPNLSFVTPSPPNSLEYGSTIAPATLTTGSGAATKGIGFYMVGVGGIPVATFRIDVAASDGERFTQTFTAGPTTTTLFWGFASDTGILSVTISPIPVGGNTATFRLDNVSFGDLVFPDKELLRAGTYTVTSGNKAVDGGFGDYGEVPAVQFYQMLDNTTQQWAWDGTTFRNIGNGKYMADAGDFTVTETTTGDPWTVAFLNGRYIIRNGPTGYYLSNSGGTLKMSRSLTYWTISPARFQPGTYAITDGSRLYCDGGFYRGGGDPTVRLWVYVPGNSDQFWTFAPVSGGYTILNQGTGKYASDKDGVLIEGDALDVWTVTAVEGGFTVKNNRTGLFLTDYGVQSGAVALTRSGSVWRMLGQQ